MTYKHMENLLQTTWIHHLLLRRRNAQRIIYNYKKLSEKCNFNRSIIYLYMVLYPHNFFNSDFVCNIQILSAHLLHSTILYITFYKPSSTAHYTLKNYSNCISIRRYYLLGYSYHALQNNIYINVDNVWLLAFYFNV